MFLSDKITFFNAATLFILLCLTNCNQEEVTEVTEMEINSVCNDSLIAYSYNEVDLSISYIEPYAFISLEEEISGLMNKVLILCEDSYGENVECELLNADLEGYTVDDSVSYLFMLDYKLVEHCPAAVDTVKMADELTTWRFGGHIEQNDTTWYPCEGLDDGVRMEQEGTAFFFGGNMGINSFSISGSITGNQIYPYLFTESAALSCNEEVNVFESLVRVFYNPEEGKLITLNIKGNTLIFSSSISPQQLFFIK